MSQVRSSGEERSENGKAPPDLPSLDILKRLSQANGVSGYESEAAQLTVQAITPFADEVHVDAMGNVVAAKHASLSAQPAGRILLAAHLDEIGLMVIAVTDGFLRFTQVGGFDVRVLPGQEVLVHGQRPLPGMIGSRPPHVLPPQDRESVTPMEDLFVDVGLPPAEVASLVSVGDLITLARQPIALQNGRLAAKALDDRAGVAAIVETFRLLVNVRTEWEVIGVATVQEEASDFLGARTGGFRLKPDLAIALDVNHAEIPDGGDVPILALGKGPGIALGPNIHPKVFRRLTETANRQEIPWQADPCPGATGTDAWALQVAGAGIPTALIDIPLRYMHSSVETLALNDVDRIARLLAAFIAELDQPFAANLRGAPCC
jgi:putative aminopeptidase FrvX